MPDRSSFPLDRRQLLAATSLGLTDWLAGCQQFGTGQNGTTPGTNESTTTDRPPAYECADASRPTPGPHDQRTDQYATYPPGPPSLGDDVAVDAYVEAYERAFRRNRILRTFDGTLTDFELHFEGAHQRFDAPEGAVVVRVSYSYTFRMSDDGTVTNGRAGANWATYYVDANVLIRAFQRTPITESERDPDPWTEGTVVDCFSGESP